MLWDLHASTDGTIDIEDAVPDDDAFTVGFVIAFGEADAIRGEPVAEVINPIAKAVKRTIDAFVPHLL